MTNTDLPRITDARTTRRRLIQGAGLVAATMLPASQMHAAPAPGSSKTFVLVHGAWHGGWCWRTVVDLLRREGGEGLVRDSFSASSDCKRLARTSDQ